MNSYAVNDGGEKCHWCDDIVADCVCDLGIEPESALERDSYIQHCSECGRLGTLAQFEGFVCQECVERDVYDFMFHLTKYRD